MKKIISIPAMLLLSGCSILPDKPPVAVHDFGFPVVATENSPFPQSKVSVEAPEWLADTHIRYRLMYAAPTQVRFYSLDRWIAPPNELFEQMLTTESLSLTGDLTIKVESFEQQFDTPTHAKAILRFSAFVTSGIDGNKLLKKDFFLEQPCATADAKGAVNGFSNMTRRAADEIRSWLSHNN